MFESRLHRRKACLEDIATESNEAFLGTVRPQIRRHAQHADAVNLRVIRVSIEEAPPSLDFPKCVILAPRFTAQ